MSLPSHFQRLNRAAERRGGRGWLLLVLFTLGYLAGWGYHFVVWASQSPASSVVAFGYNAGILVTYALLFAYLSQKVKRFRKEPARVFWSLLVLAVAFFAIAGLLLWVSNLVSPEVLIEADIRGFELDTGVPLTAATVIKMNVVALLEVSFAFLILILLRDLVQFKRTKRSMRNWTLMLALMAFTSLLSFMRSPQEELSIIQGVALLPTVGLMVTNSFRLSWVAYLSFREKTTIIGLSMLMLAVIGTGMATGGDEGFLPRAGMYLQHYSYPVGSFTLLVMIFAILYSLTALLSLIFHLPTTSDFQKKAGEMAAMHSLTTLVSQVFDPERLFASITESPVEAGTAQTTWLAIRDSRRGSLKPEIRASVNIPVANIERLVDVQALFEEAQSTSAPVLLEEAAADHRVEARPGDGLGSLLVVPLIARNVCLGALFAARDVARSFEKDDVEALTVFAAQAALALDNARLFEEKVEKERLSKELTIAREVQKRLLPQKLPELPGLALAASSVSAQEVGGDYYDMARLDEHRLAFIVADVSGKGTSAAFYMAELQGIFHALGPLVASPAEFLTHANRALSQSLERHVFVSLIYGILDAQKEELVMARAGHCPAAVIDLNGDARFIRTPGLGLGLDRSDTYYRSVAEERIRLQPGDAFVLYTDGVIESRSESGEEFGYERLLGSLRSHRHEDADVLHLNLLEDLQTFLGHDRYDDDLTLLVLKWQGVPSPVSIATNNTDKREAVRASPDTAHVSSSDH